MSLSMIWGAGRVVNTLAGRAATQRDLDRLEEWTDKDLIKFNRQVPGPAPGKKKALAMIQAGEGPTGEQLCRKGSDGQQQARSMSWEQRRPMVSRAVWRKARTVDWGKRLTPSTLPLIRLHPEYCVQLWAYEKDSDELEWVQQRVTETAEGGWRTGLWGETEGAELAQHRAEMVSGQLPPACSHQRGHRQDTSGSCFAAGHCRKSQQL